MVVEQKGHTIQVVLDFSTLVRGREVTFAHTIVTAREAHEAVEHNRRLRPYLQGMPKNLTEKTPSADALRIVREKAKECKDIDVLTVPDIHALALAYDLTPEHRPASTPTPTQEDHTKDEPTPTQPPPTTNNTTPPPNEQQPKEESPTATTTTTAPTAAVSASPPRSWADMLKNSSKPAPTPTKVIAKESGSSTTTVTTNQLSVAQEMEQLKRKQKQQQEEEDNLEDKAVAVALALAAENSRLASSSAKEEEGGAHCEEEEEEEEEEWGDEAGWGGGWVTPDNIKEVRKVDQGCQGDHISEGTCKFSTALVSTDLAVQNVAMLLKIPLVTLDGLHIKSVKKALLRCHACYTTVKDLTRQFCPSCGSGDTMQRVMYEIHEDGETELHLNIKHLKVRTRGTKYNIPRPRGGVKGTNKSVVLREDQLLKCGKSNNIRNEKDFQTARIMSDEWDFALSAQGRNAREHGKPLTSYEKARPRFKNWHGI